MVNSPLAALIARYDSCLKVEDDNYLYHYGSRFKRNFPESFSTNLKESEKEPEKDPLDERKKIIDELFLEYYRTQQHWLEEVLHILKRENNKEILNTVITNLSDAYYDVFKTVYSSLIDKEKVIAKANEKVNGKAKLPDPEIINLQKLRSSMVARIDEEDEINSQRKLNTCMVYEINPDIQAEIVEKLICIQESEHKVLSKIDWFKIEEMDRGFEEFEHKKECKLKIATARLLELRKEIKHKDKEAHKEQPIT